MCVVVWTPVDKSHAYIHTHVCLSPHTGIYYTDPLLWDPLVGTCQLSEAILGRVRKTEGRVAMTVG